MSNLCRAVFAGLIGNAFANGPAHGGYIYLSDGRVIFLPHLLQACFFVFFISLLFLAVHLIASIIGGTGSSLPQEIRTPNSVEHYEEQTSRARALKRRLDAETELTESYIRARRVEGELDELPEILGHDRAKRIARGR